jgi:fatty acid desaturase
MWMGERSDQGRIEDRAVEWPTLALIALCYGLWLIGGALYVVAPPVAVATLALTIVLHSSLQHEAIHRHPTRHAGWNEALVFLPLGLLVPYRRYRASHLRHHADARLTDPYDDPESYYLALYDWQRLPAWLRRLLAWNNMLAGRMLIGPAIASIGFLLAEAKVARRKGVGARACRDAWLRHGLGLVVVLAIVRFGFAMPIAAYLAAAYLGLSLLALRSFCEHQWAEHPDQRTVIVERSMLGLLYLNNNFHLVHHKQPGLPWYRLPGAYRARRDEWRAINRGYVYRGYGAVMWDFGLRAKEPVAHPARAGR